MCLQVDSVSAQLRKAKYTIDEMDQKLSSDIALVLKEQVTINSTCLGDLL